jgi:hypothetical protein
VCQRLVCAGFFRGQRVRAVLGAVIATVVCWCIVISQVSKLGFDCVVSFEWFVSCVGCYADAHTVLYHVLWL